MDDTTGGVKDIESGEKARRGPRPEAWRTPEGLAKLAGWSRQGLSAEQIAANAGVSRSTLYGWMKRFPEIGAAMRQERETVDFQVESALLRRALGFTYTETRTETSDKGGEKTVVTEKYALPDISALKFWLQNRRPDLWRERSAGDGDGEDGDEDGAGVILLGDVEEEEDT